MAEEKILMETQIYVQDKLFDWSLCNIQETMKLIHSQNSLEIPLDIFLEAPPGSPFHKPYPEDLF